MFHRHIAINSDDPTLPKEAKYADNGEKFKAAEMVDFNSLYVSPYFSWLPKSFALIEL